MKLKDIISEIEYRSFSAMVRVSYLDSLGIVEVVDIVRALPGVTRVSIASSDKEGLKVILKVKLITQKSGEEAFEALRKNAVERYTEIRKVEVAVNTLEKDD